MLLDTSATRVDSPLPDVWIALFSVIASASAAFYLMQSKDTLSKIPVFSYLFILNIFNFILNTTISKLTDPLSIEVFSIDMHYGCFGFFNS